MLLCDTVPDATCNIFIELYHAGKIIHTAVVAKGKREREKGGRPRKEERKKGCTRERVKRDEEGV